MSFRVLLSGKFDASVSADIVELSEKLSEHDITARVSTISVPGLKADLTVGLAIASLAVSAISTLINVITFWRNQKNNVYYLTLDLGQGQRSAEDVAPNEIKDALANDQPVSLIVEKR
jgi:hypothetical protein